MSDLLAAATPRPWRLGTGIGGDWEVDNIVTVGTHRWSSLSDTEIAEPILAGGEIENPNDAALIVSAVNEYEALLDIAKAASVMRLLNWGDRDDKTMWDSRRAAIGDALGRLNEIRSAT